MGDNNIMVSICCIAYNHASYIRECLESFVTQKCDFVFEVLVHDDASTDDTQAIIKEYEAKYPHIIKAICQTENQYSKIGSVSDINYERARGKYVAICEGDDYWCDVNKLQKQVDFLESHPDVGLCYAKAKCYNESAKYFDGSIGYALKGYEQLLRNNRIPTNTVCLRNELLQIYLKELLPAVKAKKWRMGDFPLWLYFASRLKLYFMDEYLGVYRVLPESASHSSNAKKRYLFEKDVRDIKLFFYEYGKLNNKRLKDYFHKKFIRKAFDLYKRSGDKSFISEILSSVKALSCPRLRSVYVRLYFKFLG